MRYEYLEHTADAKFRAYGKSIEEAFENAGYAMFNILADTNAVVPKEELRFKINARRIESLLYDFLEELLFLFETRYLIPSTITVKITQQATEENTDDRTIELEAVLHGDDFRDYEVNGDIKSVTYNDMQVKETKKGFELTVVVDI